MVNQESLRYRAYIMMGVIFLTGCATRHEVVSDYQEAVRRAPIVGSKSKPTVVLFLIDGFSVPVVKQLLSENQLPEIQSFFLKDQTTFRVGRAQFPTLTYVNISSILTSRPVDQQPVVGNQVLMNDKSYNFESAFHTGDLSNFIRPYSIFQDLRAQGRTSLSLAHYFGDGATARVPLDIEAGVAYQRQDFSYIDDKLIDSMKSLLSKTSPDHWPEFIFIHLVGVDSLSHTYGPYSREALDYAARMDHKLKALFKILREGEADGKKVISMMTADHGFEAINKYVNVAKLIQHKDQRITLFNQHRLITVYYPKKNALQWSEESQAAFSAELSTQPGVSIAVRRSGNLVRVDQPGKPLLIEYVPAQCADSTYALRVDGAVALCPEMIDQASNQPIYPYLVTALARYFHSPYHADLVVLAKEHYSFTSRDPGQHGGLTPEETMVPVLLRNVSIRDPNVATPTYKLLSALRKPVGDSDENSTLLAPETYVSPDEPVKSSAKYAVEFAVPFQSWSMQADNNSNHQERSFQTDPSVGLGGQFHQYWTRDIGTLLGYQFEFTNVHSSGSNQSYPAPAPEKPSQGTQFTQHFNFGGDFRFGENEKISPQLGWGQYYFSSPSGSIDRIYLPDFSFETSSRVYSFFLGDLSVLGGLKFLGSSHQDNYSVDVGFGQKLGLKFSHAVGFSDETSGKFTVEHVAQNTTFVSQSEFRLLLEFSYLLSLNGR